MDHGQAPGHWQGVIAVKVDGRKQGTFQGGYRDLHSYVCVYSVMLYYTILCIRLYYIMLSYANVEA